MAYIVFVNPSILHEAGMPTAGVTAATCLAAAIGSVLMGAFACYPIALVPGMCLNALFSSERDGHRLACRARRRLSFRSLVSAAYRSGHSPDDRQRDPHELYSAVAGGVGLFIALIGFRNAGIVVPSQSTLVAPGDMRNPATLLEIFGLLVTAVLLCAGWKAAILIGVVATWALAEATGAIHWEPQPYSVRDIASTAMQLDIRGAMRLGSLDIIFAFLFVDLFDNVGTLPAVGKKAVLFDYAGSVPRLNRILYRRRHSHGGRFDGEDVDGSQLHRKLGRRRGWRQIRCCCDRSGTAVRGSAVRGSFGGRNSLARPRRPR